MMSKQPIRTLLLLSLAFSSLPLMASAQEAAAPPAGAANTDATETAAATPKTGDPAGAGEAASPAPDAEASAAAKPDASEAAPEIPFKSRPYLVHVAVGFHNNCIPEAERRHEIVTDIRYALTRMYGRMWETEVVINDWMVPAHQRHLDWLNIDDMIARFPESEHHKVFTLTIESTGSAHTVACREFDTRIQEMTPVMQTVTSDVRAIPSVAAKLLRDLFRPCVMFLRKYVTEDGRPMMELQVQAGEIIPPDPSAEQVVENDVLRPFVRQMDRRNPNKMNKLLRLDLSYIRVMNIDRGEASDGVDESSGSDSVSVPLEEPEGEAVETEGYSPGRIQGYFVTHSPMSPFGGKGRRVQHFAVRQRPTAEESKVKIVLRGRPDKPLVSHRLALAYQLHWKDPEDGDQTALVSDRNGEVKISRRDNHPTFWIRVYSGASLLARVPYAPGLIPSDMIELPDDSIRLGVEGEIQLLSDELIDAIALRAVLLARARKAAEDGDVKGFESLIERRAQVPEKEYFLTKISNIKIPAVRKCEERRLSSTFSKRLCDGLQTSVERFFTDESRDEQRREISGLRARAAQGAAANN